MGADQKQDRTAHKDEGRGGVWLEEGRFAEAGSFEWYLRLKGNGMCHPLMSLLIGEVQKADDEQRARLALDFPDVVAALEAPDWCKAPRGRAETAEPGGRHISQATIIGQPPPETWAELSRDCQIVFGGGYKTNDARLIFHHGIRTAFNLIEGEMPPLADVKRLRAHEALPKQGD